MRILVIEDDIDTANFLVEGLIECGHRVYLADGREGLNCAEFHSFDTIVIDRILPDAEGLKILSELRARDDTTPILILSALGDVESRVEGLRAGCDDYLSKPFAFSELLARLEALERRHHAGEEFRLKVADLEMDRLHRTVTRGSRPINLLRREFLLLEYLMQNAGHVVTRAMLLENVWGQHFNPQTNVIDVHVSRLRRKIDRDYDPPLLRTVRGAGYVLAEPE